MGRFEGKTEKATPQRRRKARREGQVARSAEVGVAASLAGGALVLKVFAPEAMRVLERETILLLGAAGGGELPGAAVNASIGRMTAAVLAPFLAVAVVTAVVAGAAQTGGRAAPAAAKPKLSHLSPKRGLQRLKPATAGWELVRTVAKLGLLAALLAGPMRDWMRQSGRDRDLDAGLARLTDQAFAIVVRAVVLLVVIAAADYGYQRWRMARELRMSKEEVKQESRNAEGDPVVKGQRRRRAMELSRNRMLGAVAGADVVVTNPTHFAVALAYADGEAAPRVVAKGTDRVAARIRAEAHRNGVVVTENRPLARALYRRCKVGQFVPGALYEAVAVVLALAYRRYGRVAA